MTGRLYDAMNIPDTCRLGKRVFKKLFHENADLSVTDRKTFTDDIDTVIWQYTLKSTTLPLKPYVDDEREYTEIALLEVQVKTGKRTGRIAEIIHRAIPYPVIIVFAFDDTEHSRCMTALSMAHKRFSQAERNAIVAEEIIISEWIDLSEPTEVQKSFLDSLNIEGIMQSHFYRLYSEWYERVMALNCSRLTGEFRVVPEAERREERRVQLARCRDIEREIAELRSDIKKETGFSRKVELNTEIKQLEETLQRESSLL